MRLFPGEDEEAVAGTFIFGSSVADAGACSGTSRKSSATGPAEAGSSESEAAADIFNKRRETKETGSEEVEKEGDRERRETQRERWREREDKKLDAVERQANGGDSRNQQKSRSLRDCSGKACQMQERLKMHRGTEASSSGKFKAVEQFLR